MCTTSKNLYPEGHEQEVTAQRVSDIHAECSAHYKDLIVNH